MKDKALVGFISGMLAAVGSDIVNWIFYLTTHEGKRFLDWASIISLGHLPQSLGELIVTHLALLIWDGLMGVLFVLLISYIKPNHLVYKGILFSFALLFVFRAITILFRVQGLESVSLVVFLSQVACSIIWGALAGLSINKFNIFPENAD